MTWNIDKDSGGDSVFVCVKIGWTSQHYVYNLVETCSEFSTAESMPQFILRHKFNLTYNACNAIACRYERPVNFHTVIMGRIYALSSFYAQTLQFFFYHTHNVPSSQIRCLDSNWGDKRGDFWIMPGNRRWSECIGHVSQPQR
jgi:hypothetical protein